MMCIVLQPAGLFLAGAQPVRELRVEKPVLRPTRVGPRVRALSYVRVNRLVIVAVPLVPGSIAAFVPRICAVKVLGAQLARAEAPLVPVAPEPLVVVIPQIAPAALR